MTKEKVQTSLHSFLVHYSPTHFLQTFTISMQQVFVQRQIDAAQHAITERQTKAKDSQVSMLERTIITPRSPPAKFNCTKHCFAFAFISLLALYEFESLALFAMSFTRDELIYTAQKFQYSETLQYSIFQLVCTIFAVCFSNAIIE